jgi:choline dehydrogenase
MRRTQKQASEAGSFDYVIVGSGMAGSVIANRLTESGMYSACVLEAGPAENGKLLVQMPAGFIKLLFNPKYTWPFRTDPVPGLGGRCSPMIQGRLVGGSGSVNGMLYVRGQAQDFDAWAAMGNAGWSYEDILPYFKRGERRIGVHDTHYRGSDGPVPITDCDWTHPLCEAFLAAAASAGIPRNPDYNAALQDGSGYYQRWILDGRRQSPAQACLRPARRRPNLDVRTNACASTILFEGRRAVGVRYFANRGALIRIVRARKEVIVSAGAINTPKLLQISGVGPADVLAEIGVRPVHVLPGVGINLRDHYMVRSVARTKGIRTINTMARAPRLALDVVKWMAGQPSVLSISPSVVSAFWYSDGARDRPDVQLLFAPGSYKRGFAGLLDDFEGMTLGTYQLRPESAGYVRARTASPFDEPVIQPNYLAEEIDRRTLVAGIRLARRILRSSAFAPFYDVEVAPGERAISDEDLLAFARDEGKSCQHPAGTCRMGPASNADSVVDSKLRVIGVDGLRVADASIMPRITSGNTGAPTMMIGEKAAALMLEG